MSGMRVSVAMCTFNGERHLGDQLASIAAQTRPPDEMIVSDDGSTDRTLSILEQFATRAPFPVRIHRQAGRLGTVANFARAIALCGGELIVLSDQDDVWSERKLATVGHAFSTDERVAAVFTNGRRVDSGGMPLLGSLWDHLGFTPSQRQMMARGRAFEVLVDRNVVTGATLAMRARWREAVLPFPAASGMLHDAWIALVLAGAARIEAIDEPLIDYRQHELQQLGAGEAAGGVHRWVSAARETHADDYALRAVQLQLVHDRLATIPTTPPERLGELRGRISHLRVRGTLPPNRLARLPRVVRELAALRYFRYSNHIWSVGKDLFWR